MKSINEFSDNRKAATFDAVIFANRNKEYGAYALRKKYTKHLFVAFLIAFFLFMSGISVPLIHSWFLVTAQNTLERKDTIFITKFENNEIILPDQPKVDIPNLKSYHHQQLIVADDTMPDNYEIMTIDDQLDGLGNTFDGDLKPIEQAKIQIFEEEEIPRTFVEETATFQGGGIADFKNWVQANLSYPIDAAQAGVSGKVFIEFCVNTKGEVCDVKIIRGVHPSIDNECIRLIMNAPKWQPAKQNGRLAKQKFTLPVLFALAG